MTTNVKIQKVASPEPEEYPMPGIYSGRQTGYVCKFIAPKASSGESAGYEFTTTMGVRGFDFPVDVKVDSSHMATSSSDWERT